MILKGIKGRQGCGMSIIAEQIACYCNDIDLTKEDIIFVPEEFKKKLKKLKKK